MELREHMADAHQMKELSMKGEAGNVQERAATTWRGEPPARNTPESMRTRQEVREWRNPSSMETTEQMEATTWSKGSKDSTEAQAGTQWKGGNKPETNEEREATTWKSGMDRPGSERVQEEVTRWKNAPVMVNCPLCGASIKGRDDEDLSDELRDHLADAHHIKRK